MNDVEYWRDKPHIGEANMTYLKAHGKQIAIMAKAGDWNAQAIVSAYQIYYARPEHVALAILETALDLFRESHPDIGEVEDSGGMGYNPLTSEDTFGSGE